MDDKHSEVATAPGLTIFSTVGKSTNSGLARAWKLSKRCMYRCSALPYTGSRLSSMCARCSASDRRVVAEQSCRRSSSTVSLKRSARTLCISPAWPEQQGGSSQRARLAGAAERSHRLAAPRTRVQRGCAPALSVRSPLGFALRLLGVLNSFGLDSRTLLLA